VRYRWRLPASGRATPESTTLQAETLQAAKLSAEPSDREEKLEAIRELSRSINVPESIAAILVARGVRTFEEARDFFRPSLGMLFDPFLMDDMARAVARIKRAIADNERITIYGDYDVDGTTSTAMLVLFFESIGADLKSAGADLKSAATDLNRADATINGDGANLKGGAAANLNGDGVRIAYHIPDRFTEGYGLSTAGLDRCFQSEDGPPTLILTIDCGITAIDAVAYAQSRGADVIICDHHEPVRLGEVAQLPDAYAILNPIKGNCAYPYKYLCGCGVGFKLIQALCQEFELGDRAYEYLDFVALASSADIVSLKGENRILVSFGLKRINEHPRPGLKALIQAAHLHPGKIGTSQIVFGLAPRINAAGRLGDGGRAVQLMMSKTDDEAHHHATELEFENSNRRRIDEEAFFEACNVVDGMLNRAQATVPRDKIIVLHNPAWHAGVIGIVASRLVERYHLPVVLLTTIDGVAKGSARSIMGFDIHSAIKRCEDKVVTFGGHKYAAGVSIEVDRLPEFRMAINAVASEMISEDMLQPEIRADAVIDLSDLNPKYFAIIRQFQPFGPDNMRPVFYAKNVEVAGYPRVVGKTTPHLKFQARPTKDTSLPTPHNPLPTTPNLIPFTRGGAMEAIGFGLGERLRELIGPNGRGRNDLEMVFYLEENEYNGRVTPQLVVRDFR
jgi:single-stranded-DNA-specific exonuclease